MAYTLNRKRQKPCTPNTQKPSLCFRRLLNAQPNIAFQGALIRMNCVEDAIKAKDAINAVVPPGESQVGGLGRQVAGAVAGCWGSEAWVYIQLSA